MVVIPEILNIIDTRYHLIFTEINPKIDPFLNQHLAEAYGVNGTFQIETFTYGNDALTDVIFRQLEDTSFNGITVCPLTFSIY